MPGTEAGKCLRNQGAGSLKKTKSVSRSHKSEGKREAIVRAATEIINAKSYALAKMTEIAAALGLRDATLYYYFHDKRALAYACHRRSLERFEKVLRDVDQAGGTGSEKLHHAIRGMLVDSALNGPQLYFGEYSYLDAGQRKAISAWADRLKAILIKFIKEGMADGSIVQCEPEFVVQLILGMLIWLAKWVPAVDGITVDRLMNAIDAVSFRGLDAPITRQSRQRAR